MRKILLTSAGFENKEIEMKFIELLDKQVNKAKVIWIPTAANNPEAKAVLPKCMSDLINAGILEDNILIYDLDYEINFEKLSQYDAIYVCGGDCRYLLDKMHQSHFTELLKKYVDNGGIYIGVSAGSWICAKGFEDNLGFLECTLSVHCQEGTPSGKIESDTVHINLTNNQAILITDNEKVVIE